MRFWRVGFGRPDWADILKVVVQRVPHNPSELAAFCVRNHIDRLAFFGSVLRDDFNDESDIDILVQFNPSARVGYFDLAAMEI